jgi:membrane-associated phospholipid phosphatase
MLVLGSTLVLGLLSGFVAWLVARRWPNVDLAGPRATSRELAGELHRHPRLASFMRTRLDAQAATGLALTVTSAVVIISVGAFGILLVMVRSNTGFASFDLSAARFGAQHATPLSTGALRLLTQLGGAVVLVPLTVIVAVVTARRPRPGSLVAFLTLTVGGQFLVADLIKLAVDRTRPNIDRLTGFSGASFPSGHATAAAATFAAFALVLGRRRSVSTRSVLVGAAVGLAVAIAGSRVLLGVHWLTDVLAGLALGWAWFALCCIAFGGRLLRFAAPVETAKQSAAIREAVASRRLSSSAHSHSS